MPLFSSHLYISVFDNLDSTIPLLKILAHSGKIFASGNEIIPNMMNGLPRSVYGSEFNVMLWLNYFFTPKTSYIINEVLIHVVAYVSMYVFLKRYVVEKTDFSGAIVLLVSSLYFALLPYFSPEGLSIPLLPLVTYSLLNIKNSNNTKWDWVLLTFLPLYTNFIFVYVFYIIMAGVFLLWDSVANRKINIKFTIALFLMGSMFLLKEYRLVWSMFFDVGFISHRTEFNAFFIYDILDSLRTAHTFFLNGHNQHLIDLQAHYVLPAIIIGLMLSISKRHFTQIESMFIWVVIAISFAIDVWGNLLGKLYALPILTMYVLIIYLFTKYSKAISLLMLLQIILAMFIFFQFCECMRGVLDYIPILKMLNITRIAFIQPFIWGILIAFVLQIFLQRLYYAIPFVFIFVLLQATLSFNTKAYSTEPIDAYSSFSDYYAPDLFDRIKKDISPSSIRVVSFGLEPAVALYNGYYTVDGYITDYPLRYKHKFRKVIQKFLSETKDKNNVFDRWGSKAYLMQINGSPFIYNILKGTKIEKLMFSIPDLCSLNTDYLFSAYEIESKKMNNLKFVTYYKGGKSSWDIYVYKILCNNIDK